MSAFLLCLDTFDTPNNEIWVEELGCDLTPARVGKGLVRSSPIYSLSEGRTKLPFSKGMSNILICYTIDAFVALGRVASFPQLSKLRPKVFTSHGLGSVILFFDKQSEADLLCEQIGDLLIGYEIWLITHDRITSTKEQLPQFTSSITYSLLIDKHQPQEQVHFAAVNSCIKKLSSVVSCFPREYQLMVESVARLAQQRSLAILMLDGAITEETYRDNITTFLKDETDTDIEEAIGILKAQAGDPRAKIAAIHSLRDEAVQLHAVLHYVYAQGFSLIPPLRQSPWEPGNFSLLGIGGVYAALVSVYGQVRSAFQSALPEATVSDQFPGSPPPAFLTAPDDATFRTWQAALRATQQRVHALPPPQPLSGPFHLVYFSHRLGFRATKLSVTAAWQSIILGHLPSWSLTTLFHEYLHIHTKSILVELYPIQPGVFEEAYALYARRLEEPESAKSLTSFFRVAFLEAAAALFVLERDGRKAPAFQRVLEKNALVNAARIFYDEIDELLVHVLDLQYFHSGDCDLYVKAIWASWLNLPFAAERTREYLFRTIFSISAMSPESSRTERFDWSVTKVRTQISQLKLFSFVRDEMVDRVLQFLDNVEFHDELRHRYFALSPLLECFRTLLVFPKLGGLLTAEGEDEEVSVGEFGYGYKLGEYTEHRIESTVSFMIAQAKLAFNIHTPIEAFGTLSRRSLWLFQALASSLNYGRGTNESRTA